MRLILTADGYEHIDEMQKRLNIQALLFRRKQHTCHCVYAAINDLSTPKINSMFNIASHAESRQTRPISNMDLSAILV